MQAPLPIVINNSRSIHLDVVRDGSYRPICRGIVAVVVPESQDHLMGIIRNSRRSLIASAFIHGAVATSQRECPFRGGSISLTVLMLSSRIRETSKHQECEIWT